MAPLLERPPTQRPPPPTTDASALTQPEPIDRLVLQVAKFVGLMTVLSVVGLLAMQWSLARMWPALGDRLWPEAKAVLALVGTLLAVLTTARVPFHRLWAIVGALAALAIAAAGGPPTGFVSLILVGLVSGMTLHLVTRRVGATPAQYVTRLVLPLTVHATSPLYRAPSAEHALRRASRRSWFMLGASALVLVGLFWLQAARSYRPSLEPEFDAFVEAWDAGDLEHIVASFEPSHQAGKRTWLAKEFEKRGWTRTDEGTGTTAANWPTSHGSILHDEVPRTSRSTYFLDGAAIETLAPATILLDDSGVHIYLDGGPSIPAGPALRTTWAYVHGEWVLFTFQLLPED